MENIVIFGSGIAGVNAATALAGIEGYKIVLIQGENYLPYYRMRLEEVVTGSLPESIFIHPLSWYEDKKIELIKARVEHIDKDNKVITFSDGESLSYKFLIIATGARANKLSLDGDSDGLVLRDMDDAIKLREALKSGKKNIVIAGAGLLGIELAKAIKEKYDDVSVTLLENQSYILSKQLDVGSALYLTKYLKEKGLKIKTGVNAKYYGNGVTLLDNGDELETDLLIYSVGVHPDKEVAQSSLINTNRGIIVDSNLLTSAKDVFALGDVAELNARGFSLALYAREMALHVAKEIKEGELFEYIPSSPSSILKIAGLSLSFFGTTEGSTHLIENDGSRVTLFEKDDILVGAILINAQKYLTIIKNALNKKFDKNIIK